MKKYLQIVKINFALALEYRFYLFWLFSGNIVSFGVMILFFLTIYSSSTQQYFSSQKEIIIYYLLIGFIGIVNDFPIHSIGHSIRDGEIINTVLKPLSHIGLWFYSILPNKLITGFGYVCIFIIFFLKDFFEISIITLLKFILIISIGVLGRFVIAYFIGILTIWFKRSFGIYAAFGTIELLFSGMLIPLDLLPEIIQKISMFLPFRYFVYLPVNVFLGKINFQELVQGLIIEVFWLLMFVIIVKYTYKLGMKSLETIGI